MAKAWKCDRCSKYFSGYAYKLKMTSVIQFVQEDKNMIKIESAPNYETLDFDLCKKCAMDVAEEILDPIRNMKAEMKEAKKEEQK